MTATNATNTATDTLAAIVEANPTAARLFDGLGLDYCCQGNRTLAAACIEANLDTDDVARQLTALPAATDGSWTDLDLAAMADRIVETHHRYLHEELPQLDALAAKVLSVHGERHPELAKVRELVSAIRADLEPHLMKEERVLFPAIHAVTEGRRTFPFGSIADPIRMMSMEHDRAGELLAELRDATNGYTVPADGCASYRSLYERLAELEADTHLHVHRENHLLFPAAIALAEREG